MDLRDTFVISLLAVLGIVLWVCIRFRRSFMAWWACVSLVLGIAGSYIPWRSPNGRHHGTGAPIPHIIWERDDTRNIYLDFPNPPGFVENPVFIFVVGLIIWGLLLGIRALFQRLRSFIKVT